MANPTSTKEARLIATLTELSSTGRLRWALKTPASLRAGTKSIPAHLRYCYEADFGDSYLVLYENSVDRQTDIGIGVSSAAVVGGALNVLAMLGRKLSLSIIRKESKDETLQITGRILTDLYSTVQTKAGSANSVIDDLLETARGF